MVARIALPVLFSVLWILSLPRLILRLNRTLVRIAWLRRVAPDAGRLILNASRRSGPPTAAVKASPEWRASRASQKC